jgi:hypothetical protein
MNKVTKAQKVLDRIAMHTGLTEDGKKWMIEVLDPMHDKKMDVVGYPDRETAPSIVQMVKQSVDISIPTASGWATNQWGVHIMIDDNAIPCGTNQFQAGSDNAYVLLNNTSSASRLFPIGGVNIVAFLMSNTADPTWQVNTGSAVPNVQLQGLALPPGYLSGKTRVISQGMEVVNTTAELYKGGTLLVYESPDSKSEHSVFNVVYQYTTLLDYEEVVRK